MTPQQSQAFRDLFASYAQGERYDSEPFLDAAIRFIENVEQAAYDRVTSDFLKTRVKVVCL